MRFPELAFLRLEHRARPCDHVDWALALLSEGCANPAVFELASFGLDSDPDAQAVERIFQACVRELNLSLPTDQEWVSCLLAYGVDVCERLEDGLLSPTAARDIFWNLFEDGNEPHLLWIWADLASDLFQREHPPARGVVFNAGLADSSADELTLAIADQFVRLCRIALPDIFPRVWICLECEAVDTEDTEVSQAVRACPGCGAGAALSNMRYMECRERFLSMGSERHV